MAALPTFSKVIQSKSQQSPIPIGCIPTDSVPFPLLSLGMLEPEIASTDYARLRDLPNPPLLLDVREPWEFETAKLPEGLLMPMGEVTSRAHIELDPDQPIIVLCHHGARSLSVTMWLRQQGFDHAQSLAGGIDAWSRSVDSAIPRY